MRYRSAVPTHGPAQLGRSASCYTRVSDVLKSWRRSAALLANRPLHFVFVVGHHTREDAFWNGLKEIASKRDMNVSELITVINSERQLVTNHRFPVCQFHGIGRRS